MPSMEIKKLFLQESHFEINKNFNKADGLHNFAYQIMTHCDDVEKNIIYVQVGASTPASEEEIYPFNFKVVYAGKFSFDEDIPSELKRQYCNVNCPAIIFPFLREFVTEITTRSGFAPLILPPINFVKYSKEKDKITKKDG